jgi:nucleoside-diphosphate-sugar epimerase
VGDGGRRLDHDGGGFVGRRLLSALAAEPRRVHALVRPGGTDAGVVGVEIHHADIASPAALDVIARARPDVVVHLAVERADASREQRLAAARTNVLGTAIVLEAALAAGAERVVHVGGALEYGRSDAAMDEATPIAPEGWYGATKAAAALLAGAAQTPCVILRPFLVYGPGQSADRLIPTVLRAAREGNEVPLTPRGAARDWVHVDDVVAAIAAAAARSGLAHGTVINVGSGEQHTNEEVVALASEVTRRRIAVREGAHPARRWDRPGWRADTRLLERLLGVRPRGLRAGLEELWTG